MADRNLIPSQAGLEFVYLLLIGNNKKQFCRLPVVSSGTFKQGLIGDYQVVVSKIS